MSICQHVSTIKKKTKCKIWLTIIGDLIPYCIPFSYPIISNNQVYTKWSTCKEWNWAQLWLELYILREQSSFGSKAIPFLLKRAVIQTSKLTVFLVYRTLLMSFMFQCLLSSFGCCELWSCTDLNVVLNWLNLGSTFFFDKNFDFLLILL